MNPDYKNIFAKSTCLTNSEMTNYLSGNLSAEKIHKLEKHLADCEMCNDELEGLSIFKNTKKLPLIIKSLNNRIDSYFSEKTIIPTIKKSETKNFSIKRILSIAASIALLITVGYFINNFANKTSNNLAQTEIPNENITEEKILVNPKLEDNIDVKENITETKDDEKSNTTNLTENSNIEQVTNENEGVNNVANNLDEQEIKLTSSLATSNEITEVNEEEDVSVPSVGSPSKLPEKTVAENTKEDKVSFLGTRRGIIKSKNNKKSSIDYSNLRRSGLLSYDVKTYKDAVIDFDKYLAFKTNDFEIIYKTGMSYFYMDKYKFAISKFNKIISAKNIKYFEDAQWYKATALLNLGKNDDALTLLKQIESAKGKYSKKAKDVILIMNN